HSLGFIGYVQNERFQWLDLEHGRQPRFDLQAHANRLRATLTLQDDNGARWQIQQAFTAATIPDAIEVRMEIKLDHDRAVAFLPLLTLFPGAGTFGQR